MIYSSENSFGDLESDDIANYNTRTFIYTYFCLNGHKHDVSSYCSVESVSKNIFTQFSIINWISKHRSSLLENNLFSENATKLTFSVLIPFIIYIFCTQIQFFFQPRLAVEHSISMMMLSCEQHLDGD